jgi:phenylacetate-CoA ligase
MEIEKNYWDGKMECIPQNELKVLQEEKLGKLLRFVRDRSKFFRTKIESPGIDISGPFSVKQLREIPPTTRKELAAEQAAYPPFGNFPCVTLDQSAAIGMTGVGISISGKRLNVMATHADVRAQGALLMRILWEAGVRPADKIYVADDPRYNLIPIYIVRAITDIHATNIYVASERSKRNAQFTAKAIAPNHYFLTPTYAHYIAALLKQEHQKPLPIKSIFGWGEPGFSIKGKREILRKQWEAVSSVRPFTILDIYAMSEVGVLAGGCKKETGLHGFEDALIYEVLDPDSDRTLEEGEKGELVITHLNNGAMPLIRYRTGDLTSIDRSPCPCGRTHVRLMGVDRISDAIQVKGRVIYANDVEEVLHRDGQMINFRIVKESDSIEALRVLLNDEKICQEVEKRLREKFSIPVAVEVRDAQTLPPYIHRSFRVFYPDKEKIYQEIYEYQLAVE